MRLESEFSLSSSEARPAPHPPFKPDEPALLFQISPAAILAATMQQLIDELPEEIALLDESCTILTVNRSWRRVSEEHGYFESLPGQNYRALCASRAAQGYQPAAAALAAIDEIVSGKRDSWRLIYNGGERWSGRDFEISYHRIRAGAQSLISITRSDLTEILALRRARNERIFDQASQNPSSDLLHATVRELIAGFSEQVAVVDEDWTIIEVNDAWRTMAEASRYPELMPGLNYYEFLTAFSAKGHATAEAARSGIEAIRSGATNSFEMTYAGADHWEGRAFHLKINRLHLYGRALATITREDITAAAELGRLRDAMSDSIVRGQAVERQRMARELHDSASQLLTGVGLLLCRLKKDAPGEESRILVDELQGLVKEAQQEIRVVSYLALPPALEKLGLVDALKAVVDGFGHRTDIDVSFDVSGEECAIPMPAATALYRCAQEALSNAHRHAHATHMKAHLRFRRNAAHLIIADDGVGFPGDVLNIAGRAGVGLSSMKSRLSEIGGRLTVMRLHPGTAVVASVLTPSR